MLDLFSAPPWNGREVIYFITQEDSIGVRNNTKLTWMDGAYLMLQLVQVEMFINLPQQKRNQTTTEVHQLSNQLIKLADYVMFVFLHVLSLTSI